MLLTKDWFKGYPVMAYHTEVSLQAPRHGLASMNSIMCSMIG